MFIMSTGYVIFTFPSFRYVSHVALAAAFSALDIGLSQWSFEYITISLYTMTKTTSIIFILIFAIFLKLEEKVCDLI